MFQLCRLQPQPTSVYVVAAALSLLVAGVGYVWLSATLSEIDAGSRGAAATTRIRAGKTADSVGTAAGRSNTSSGTLSDDADRRREIALLISFPNSGTSYTLGNVEKLANVTAATNYGDEQKECCHFVFGDDNGDINEENTMNLNGNSASPFLLKPDLMIPNVVLTKSHCDVSASSFEDFNRACHEVWMPSPSKLNNVTWRGQPNGAKVSYSNRTFWAVRRVVHLIRSPLDNLVARKHMAVRHKIREKALTKQQAELFGSDTAEGFHAWCQYLDSKTKERLPDDVKALLSDDRLPCVSDLYRYIWWHNYATLLPQKQERIGKVHTLFYEDYTSNYDSTVDELLDFLDLQPAQSPLPFVPSKTYKDFYSGEQVQAIERFVREHASPYCMKMLSRYF